MGSAGLAAFEALFSMPRSFDAYANIAADGERVTRLHILLDGWACQYKRRADGRRQITAVLLPGDICNLSGLYLEHANYAVSTLTPCTVATLSCPALRALVAGHPDVARGLGWLGALENAALLERNFDLGRRSAHERIAHLLCELFVRLSAIGHAQDNGYMLPLTQEDISDVLGLSVVHVSRVLKELRSKRLIAMKRRDLTILDLPMLCEIAEFRPDYLQLGGLDDAATVRNLAS